MKRKNLLLNRLHEIARSVEHSAHGMAMIGLGSAGREINRLDDFSDLDFFVIVDAGYKQQYISDLGWLSGIAPLAYQFRNTPDGYKVLFDDGVFCEFAVFEFAELQYIPYAPGRIIWKRFDVDDSVAVPVRSAQAPAEHSPDWLLNEILTGLYVGLCRYRRDEKLSANRFVQHIAVDHLIELYELTASLSSIDKDPFAYERRIEQRHPELISLLPAFIQGYERCVESAEAILNYLDREYVINQAMAAAIRQLIALKNNG